MENEIYGKIIFFWNFANSFNVADLPYVQFVVYLPTKISLWVQISRFLNPKGENMVGSNTLSEGWS